jgi:hypothetical protein
MCGETNCSFTLRHLANSSPENATGLQQWVEGDVDEFNSGIQLARRGLRSRAEAAASRSPSECSLRSTSHTSSRPYGLRSNVVGDQRGD